MRLFGFSPTRTTRPAWLLAELDIDYEPVTDIIVGWTCHFAQGLDGFNNINAYVARLMQRPKCALPVHEVAA
jgi:hypothetical protein